MQLTGHKSIRPALATITAALLGTGATAQTELSRVESSLLLYSETDRVKALESATSLSWRLKGERTVGVKFTYDGLTGASPSGATPSRRIQTFTRPSGQGSYTIPAGTTPLDDTFRDTRIAVDASYTQPLGRLVVGSFGGHYSGEHDYASFGLNTSLTADFFRRNTTVGISAAWSHDLISPEGGAPTPMTAMAPAGEAEPEEEDDDHDDGASDKTKNVLDAVLSLTQVLDRNTLARVNYSFSRSSGYLSDPYKIVSVVQDPGDVEPGEPVQNLYESRPDLRVKHALFGEVRRNLGGNTVDLAYRYFWDDWGVTAHTVDVYYRQQLGGGHALRPHVRWYRQSEADFFTRFLVNGDPWPTHASADYRLGAFDALTYGLQYFLPVGRHTRFNVAAEFYQQRGRRAPPDAFGVLTEFDLFPDLDVLMIRSGISFEF